MKKVLLATDGSKCAEEAAWFLSHLPHAEKLDLAVLTVLQIPYVSHRYLSPNAITESVDRERASAVEAYGRIERCLKGRMSRCGMSRAKAIGDSASSKRRMNWMSI